MPCIEKLKYIQYLSLNNKLHSSYIIFEKRIEKTYKFSQTIIAWLLCNNKTYMKTCTKCRSCKLFFKNSHPDYYSITTKNNIKVEEIKNILSKIEKKPIISKKNIILIHSCDLMTDKAANCLLKTLEEPPKNTIFLLTTNHTNLMSTISSRCLLININKYTETIQSKKTAKFIYKCFNKKNYTSTFVKKYILSIKNDDIGSILDTAWFIFTKIIKYKHLSVKTNKKTLFKISSNLNNKQIKKIFTYINNIITIKYLLYKKHNININFFINYMSYSLYES